MKNLLAAILLTLGVGAATAQTTAPTAKKQVTKTEKKATKTVEAQAANVANTPDAKPRRQALIIDKTGTRPFA